MGKKIPYDVAMKMESVIPKETDSIFIDPSRPNPYGFKISVNHPKIRPLYEAYHKHIGVPPTIHLTTAQRLQFETAIITLIRKRSETHVQ